VGYELYIELSALCRKKGTTTVGQVMTPPWRERERGRARGRGRDSDRVGGRERRASSIERVEKGTTTVGQVLFLLYYSQA